MQLILDFDQTNRVAAACNRQVCLCWCVNGVAEKLLAAAVCTYAQYDVRQSHHALARTSGWKGETVTKIPRGKSTLGDHGRG